MSASPISDRWYDLLNDKYDLLNDKPGGQTKKQKSADGIVTDFVKRGGLVLRNEST